MKALIIKWLLNAISLLVAAYIVPGVKIKNFITALILVIIIGLLNAILKPILEFFSFPFIILTLGLFSVIINAIILIIASKLVEGFIIENFLSAIYLAIILSIVNWIMELIF